MAEIFYFLSIDGKKKERKQGLKVSKSSIWEVKKKVNLCVYSSYLSHAYWTQRTFLIIKCNHLQSTTRWWKDIRLIDCNNTYRLILNLVQNQLFCILFSESRYSVKQKYLSGLYPPWPYLTQNPVLNS